MESTQEKTRFWRACFGKPVDRIPVWMMRQAGRYLPAYQELKKRASFWELCTTPELAAQATLDAARILDTDAAIIFSDITVPGWAMGLEIQFAPGPQFATPVRDMAGVAALHEPDPATRMPFVLEAIRQTRAQLPNDVSLIGFVGAPFTLASYMVEGVPSKQWQAIKAMAYGAPDVLHALLDRVSNVVAAHARAQVEAGCDALQLFDSTAGQLAEAELHTFAFAYAQKVLANLQDLGVPLIYFARDIGAHLEPAAQLGAHVLGLDWTVSLSRARERVPRTVLMGNLDPTVLFTNFQQIDQRVRAILDASKGLPGFVFNLGHGVLPKTPPEHARQVVRSVRAWSSENLGG